jgi:hypothetical protein
MKDPKESHWKEVKQIFRYLKGTTHFGIKYFQSLDSLVGFTNPEWDGENDDKKSTFFMCFTSTLDHWFGLARNRK